MIATTTNGEASRKDLGLVRSEGCAYCMGTIFNIVAYGTRRERLESGMREALEEAKRLDETLSNYLPESELTRVSRLGEQGPVNVSSEFFQFLSASLEYSRASEGAFDITVGPLLKVAGFYRGT